jgi:hypothetical protein
MIGSEAADPREFAVAVGRQLREALETLGLEYQRDMCRYELKMHEWAAKRDAATDRSPGRMTFDGADFAVSSTKIRLCGDVALEAFEHDVEELAQLIASHEKLPDDADARFRTNDPLLVLFHRGSFPQKVSRGTATLLALLQDEPLTMDEISFRLGTALGVRTVDIAANDLADILQGLFWEGIIAVEVDQEPVGGITAAAPMHGVHAV